jgi:hypothetical protein
MMGKRNHNPFILTIDDNDIVWKPAKNKAFRSLISQKSRHGREGKKAVFYDINGSFNRFSKLGTEAMPFSFIPSGCRFSFIGGLAHDSYYRH